MKTCTKCDVRKALVAFSLKAASKDGYCPACKDCLNIQAKSYRKINSSVIVERQRTYYQSEAGKLTSQRGAARARVESPVKCRARSTMNNAIQSGKLIRLPCVQCGCIKSEGHHHDYSKPLDVIWLCKKHHTELHKADENGG